MVDCVGGLTKITENIVKGTTHFHSKMYEIAFQCVYNKKDPVDLLNLLAD